MNFCKEIIDKNGYLLFKIHEKLLQKKSQVCRGFAFWIWFDFLGKNNRLVIFQLDQCFSENFKFFSTSKHQLPCPTMFL